MAFWSLLGEKKNNLKADEHAYIVFGKNINGSKHITEQKEILLKIKSVPETSFPLE